MASHSPQRARRPPQVHQLNQGLAQNLQPREPSRSPSLRERPRASKAQSAPIVPSVAQMYAQSSVVQQVTQPSSQASPTVSNAATMQRMHATPPQNGSSNENGIPQPHSHLQNQNNLNPHYTHSVNRSQPPSSLTRYQTLDDDYQITPELLADIERADLQQSQNQGTSSPFGTYPRNDSTTPPKDFNIERIRAVERGSPKELDQRWQRDSMNARESPKVRDRQPNSPSTSAFAQAQGATPERRPSPARASPLGSSGETYTAYSRRDSPPVHRRAINPATGESRSQYSLASQTPPLQAIQARSSDRSLPVQEEPEDDPGISLKNDPNIREAWKGIDHLEPQHRSSSPAPSSDLHPEGNTQRFETSHSAGDNRSGRRDDDQLYLTEQEESEPEGANTPRSPSVGLPDNKNAEKYVQPTTAGARAPVRVTGRNGSMDQLGLQGIDQTIYQPTPQAVISGPHPSTIERPHQFTQQRRSLDQSQYYADESSSYPRHYVGYPEDFHTYNDPSLPLYHDDHYAEGSRPGAPIPPTPHSQTAAPSPSPLITGMYARNGKNYAPSPVAPVGSPYPYPFSHVRRAFVPPHPNRPAVLDQHDPAVIQEQLARQWQIYAQNNLGNISDSTFSPSSTPFQGAFNPWANLHAKRTLGRAFDTRSMQSSPSHEPIPLPPAPTFAKKKADASKLSREVQPRKPPPRVESTQPRDTSPEPSSSGEETAGEDRYSVQNRNSWSNGVVSTQVVEEDGDGDWVDEDEEPDDEDLLELEYHPSYINNIAKRRRRWEIGWEALLEAFQTLDRQTDATMVLLAAPSHSTKLYSVRSRSVKRQALQTNAPDTTPLRIGFKRIAAHRRRTRSHVKSSLVDRFLVSSNSSGEGSDGSESREEDLKRALEAAVNSLGAFQHIFEEREARWAEETRRINDDRERVTNLLRQVIGERYPSDLPATTLS